MFLKLCAKRRKIALKNESVLRSLGVRHMDGVTDHRPVSCGAARLRGVGFSPVGRRIMRSGHGVGELERAGRMARAWRPVALSASVLQGGRAFRASAWASERVQRARCRPAGTGRADGIPLAARGIVGSVLQGGPSSWRGLFPVGRRMARSGGEVGAAETGRADGKPLAGRGIVGSVLQGGPSSWRRLLCCVWQSRSVSVAVR